MPGLELGAHPRIGLLGNPSDLYGGKVIGFTFVDFAARVTCLPADRVRLAAAGGRATEFPSIQAVEPRSCTKGHELLAAAVRRFSLWAGERLDPTLGVQLEFASDIPRQVGLAGSSAIVVATLRALARHFAVELSPFDVSELALAAETEELAIVAGPQDRVLQAYGGLLHMDFGAERRPERYTRLDPRLLPPLYLAFDPEPGQSSGAVHDAVRTRWREGDPEVRAVMARFPALVDEGLAALKAGDHGVFARCVDANFDLRASIWPIGASDRRMIEIGRARGAAVKFCGSGGAVVGVLPDDISFRQLEQDYERAGYRVLRPTLPATL